MGINISPNRLVEKYIIEPQRNKRLKEEAKLNEIFKTNSHHSANVINSLRGMENQPKGWNELLNKLDKEPRLPFHLKQILNEIRQKGALRAMPFMETIASFKGMKKEEVPVNRIEKLGVALTRPRQSFLNK